MTESMRISAGLKRLSPPKCGACSRRAFSNLLNICVISFTCRGTTKMTIDAKKLPKLRALFALRRMSPEMQSNVLSDSSIAEKAEIKLSKTIRLSENVSVDRALLFEAIRCAAEGRAAFPLVDSEKKVLDAQVEVRDDAALI